MNRSYEMAFPIVFDTWLPDEIWQEIVTLNNYNSIVLACVNKQFESWIKNYRPEGCFGKVQWLHYGGDPGIEPAIPPKMIQDFDASKQMLTLIPETLNGEALTLSSIDAFVSKCKSISTSYKYQLNHLGIVDATVKEYKAHWVMLSKDVLEGTRSNNYISQKVKVKAQGFEIPSLIDAVVSLLMHNLKTQEYYYPAGCDSVKWTFTRVKERNRTGNRVVVGGFSALGLYVTNDRYDYGNFSMACAKTSSHS